jgi:hypothetical protein
MSDSHSLLYEEQVQVGKRSPKTVSLKLLVNIEEVESIIEELRQELKDYQFDPDSLIESEYVGGHENKTVSQVLSDMEKDIENFTLFSKGLVKRDELSIALDAIQKEIFGESNKVKWEDYFEKIARKADGTFAKGRIVSVYKSKGFAYEDEESYGVRGYEMIIKTEDDDIALLRIRRGIVEKW